MNISRGKLTKPRRCLLYGPRGIGKSTCAQDALVLDIEGGTGDIDCARLELQNVDYNGFVEALGTLFEEPFEQSTVAIDSIDWLEKLMAAEICKREGVPSLTSVEYGKGPGMLIPFWEYIMRGLDKLRTQLGKNILLLCHEQIEKVTPPDSPHYQRYSPDLHSSEIQDWCDEIFFYRYRVVTASEDLGFKKTRNVAVSTRERYLQCTETAGAVAKNRVGLADEIGSFDEYKAFLAK